MSKEIEARLRAAASNLRKDGSVSVKFGDSASSSAKAATPRTVTKKTPSKKRHVWVVLALLILASGALVTTVLTRPEQQRTNSVPAYTGPVPTAVRKSVSFPVYYTDPARLPTGYSLDKQSFSSKRHVVLFAVNYAEGQHITFTIQKKPTAEELETFYKNQLPLHNDVKTNYGVAIVGILNNQTFASLTTDDGAWIIVAAPKNINADQFNKILLTIRK